MLRFIRRARARIWSRTGTSIGLATHPKHSPQLTVIQPEEPKARPEALPRPGAKHMARRQPIRAAASALHAGNHAAEFGVRCMRADPDGETALVQMHDRYCKWCAENAHPKLAPPELARELGVLFTKAGLPIEDRGDGNIVVRGVRLA